MTGGGSGGHTMVAAATIAHLLQQQLADVVYIGSHHGVEGPTARALGVPFFRIRTGKLRRASTWRRMLTLRNALDVLNVSAGLAQAALHLARLRPDLLLSTGGYVAVPVAWAAAALGVRVVLHEQTLQLGLANRLTAGLASGIAVANELALGSLSPRLRHKAVITGTPIREGILAGSASGAAARFQLREGLPTVLVTGGAQGAETLNRAVLDALPSLLEECNVLHQCGAGAGLRTGPEALLTAARAATHAPGRYWLKPFLDEAEMADAYAASALVVGRSGAGTTNELAATAKPALLIPLVPASGDEQRRSALRLQALGAALLVPNEELSGARLFAEVSALLRDPERRRAMARAMAMQAPQQPTSKLVALLLKHARPARAPLASHGSGS